MKSKRHYVLPVITYLPMASWPHALGLMMSDYTLLVLVNQRVLNKPTKEHNKTG